MEHINQQKQQQSQKSSEEAQPSHLQGTEKTVADTRPATLRQRELQEVIQNSPSNQKAAQLKSFINNSPQVQKARQLQRFVDNSSYMTAQRKRQEELFGGSLQRKKSEEEEVIQGKEADNEKLKQEEQPVQQKENKTGLPDNLKSGIENLSGYSMDDVNVHYNSDKPSQLQAHAYAQGSDIHIGHGQEKHLPHEAWHVVQQKQGRVKPTMQMKGMVNINDDAGLEKEADEMGAKALMDSGEKMGSAVMNKEGTASDTIQGMFDWSYLTEVLGPYLYYALTTLGAYTLYKIISLCFKQGKKSKEELKEALDEAIQGKKEDKDDKDDKQEDSQSGKALPDPLLDQLKEAEHQSPVPSGSEKEVPSDKPKQDDVVEALPPEVVSSVQKNESPPVKEAVVDKPVSSDKPGSSKESEKQEPAPESSLEPSNRGKDYLKDLKNTNMWGGYAEANAIATHFGFSCRIYGARGGRIYLYANIGNGAARALNLFWSGNHYQVISGNFNDGDPVPPINYDPVGDGNCMFVAMFYILRQGGNHIRDILEDAVRRGIEVRNMRSIAAQVLAEGDPALLNYLGEEYHASKENKKEEWKNIHDGKLIGEMILYENLLMTTYKNFPPKDYFIQPEKKQNWFVDRKNEGAKTNISIFLRDNKDINESLKDEKNSKKSKTDFENWLCKDSSYSKEVAKKEKSGELPEGYDEHSFKATDSKSILAFLESKVPGSLNLKNCSEHLDGSEGRTTKQFDKRPVYHYSRGRDQWGQQYSVFYTLLDESASYIKIIGIGSHAGSGTSSYKLEWGIGEGDWVNGKNFGL